MNDLTFVQLSKNCKKDTSGMPSQKMAVMGDCATQHLSTAIKGYAYEEGCALNVLDIDYNQIEAQVLDSASELYAFEPQHILIYMCTEKLYEKFCGTPLSERPGFADRICGQVNSYWSLINTHMDKVNILQFTFVEEDDRAFGNYALKTDASFLYQVKKLNFMLCEGCRETKNAYLIDLNTVKNLVGSQLFRDGRLYHTAKIPISIKALPEVAKNVVDMVLALSGHFKKCVITDLDNTLWGGVIGDDGMDGIQIGELGIGHAFTDLQLWLKELKNRGIILAVCSKNNEDIANQPFLEHPEMVLRMDDISVFVANWEDKASNIRKIQETLNIGMDSIVFLDDNKFERELVRSTIPEITVPELPEDPAEYLDFLKGENLFETASFSSEDADRTRQYQAEIGRTKLKQQFVSFDDYLSSLEMEAFCAPFDEFHYPRIAQLTQRSNQFNLRTVRYTESEIESIALDETHLTLYFTLRDKFGDHGLISVVILDKHGDEELFISEWLMSCRVLKRGMEEFIADKIVQIAGQNGFSRVVGEYIPTQKNAMVRDLYERLGFQRVEEKRFEAYPSDYNNHKTFIKDGTLI